MLPMTQTELATLASDGLPPQGLTGSGSTAKILLCRYLDIMTHGVGRKWQGKLAFVDLFSDPVAALFVSAKEVDGSPVLRTQLCNSHDNIFVESLRCCRVSRNDRYHPKFCR